MDEVATLLLEAIRLAEDDKEYAGIEEYLLGSMLIDARAAAVAPTIVGPEDFEIPTHQVIFDCMAEMVQTNEPIDMVTLGQRLESKRQLNRVGGYQYIAHLVNSAYTGTDATAAAWVVWTRAICRRVRDPRCQ
jgi:replicative DNA helicase